MQSRIFSILTFGLFTLIIVAGVVLGWKFSERQNGLETSAQLLQVQTVIHQSNIDELQTQVAALLEANQSVAQELKAEAEKRIAAEQASKEAQNKLSQLEQTVQKNTLPKTSDIISEWRPRIAAVYCEWPIKNGTQPTKSGTAVLLPENNLSSPSVITSEHLVTNADELPVGCALDFPDQKDDIEITKEAITLSESKYDWARISLANAPAFAITLARTPAARCASTPSIGDGVVILGYPKIGTKSDITATEGIISGFDGKYYITSAKVERGNSGGAAILIKENCYLGIPTFVDAGEIESLARILSHQQIDN